MTQNLILDAGGVMVYPLHGYWDVPVKYREYLGEYARLVGSEGWIAALEAARPHLREDVFVSGMEEEFSLQLAFLRTMIDQLGWDLPEERLAALAEDFTWNTDRYAWYGDVDGFLAAWQKRMRIGVLSDAMPSFLRVARAHDVHGRFEEIVISTAVGATKPDARMYAAICKKMHVSPEDCLFVDDKICNLQGAIAFGMHAVQMDRSGRIPLWNGPVVHNFAELDQYMAGSGQYASEENP